MTLRLQKKSTLLANFAAYATGNFAQQATNFLLLFVLARFLSPRDIGITGTLAVYSAVISIIMMLQLNGAVSRFYWKYKEDAARLNTYTGSIWVFQMALATLITGFLALWPGWWEAWQAYKPLAQRIAFWPAVPLAMSGILFVAGVSVPLALLQAREEATTYVKISLSRLIISGPLSFVLVAGFGMGAVGILLAQSIAGLFVLSHVLIKYHHACFPARFNFDDVKEALTFSFPLVPHALAAWILMSADRAVLERYSDLVTVGAYGLAVTASMCVESIASSINSAWQPQYFRIMSHAGGCRAGIKRALIYYGLGYGLFCLVAILFAGEVMSLLLPEKHHQAISFIAPLILARLWGGWYYFACTPLFFYQKTKIIPVITTLAGLVGLSLNLVLVPKFGAIAAAWNSVFTITLMTLMFQSASRRFDKLPFPWYPMLVVAGCCVCGSLLPQKFPVWSSPGFILKLMILAVAGVVCGFIFRVTMRMKDSPDAEFS